MGLLTTVMKKSDAPVNTNVNVGPGDEKKILMNITSRMDDLKNQNLQNAKFLRGISRKIETELSQMREMEENKSIEVYDDSALVESINRVEQSLHEINNNEILNAIDRVNASLNEINSSEVMDSIDKINRSLGEINQEGVMEEVIKVGEAIEKINNDNILIELKRINDNINRIDFTNITNELDLIKETLTDANPEVVLIEVDKINKALKDMSSVTVLEEVNKANQKLEEINMEELFNEIHRVEAIVSEINENAVLAELEKVKQLINEKNSADILKELKTYDYSAQIAALEEAIKSNEAKIEELGTKVDRVNTMPNMLRSVIEHNSSESLKKMEELLEEINNRERKKNDGMRLMLNINLWVSLLTLAVLIANILGMI